MLIKREIHLESGKLCSYNDRAAVGRSTNRG